MSPFFIVFFLGDRPIANSFWYQKPQKVWPSTDLLEASTNYAMRVDILRMEIGEIILINQLNTQWFAQCAGTEAYMLT